MRRGNYAGIGLVITIAGMPVAAQQSGVPVARLNCVSASQIVTRPHDPALAADAYAVLIRCPRAAETLAQVWSSPPSDSHTLTQLSLRSAQIADRRIAEATLRIVRNALFSPSIRRAALDVVIAHYGPSFVVSQSTWNDPEHTSLARRIHHDQSRGEEPITLIERKAILDGLRVMSESEPDGRLRRVATRVVSDLPSSP